MNYVSLSEAEYTRLRAIETAALKWKLAKEDVVVKVLKNPTQETYAEAMEPLGHALDELIAALEMEKPHETTTDNR